MIIDLSIPINEKTPSFPGDLRPRIRKVATIKKNGWNESRLEINSHFGTHIDAPYHMLKTGKKLSDYPIDDFIGKCIVIDTKFSSLKSRILTPDLSCVKNQRFVLFHTGFIAKINSKSYFDTDKNPVLSLECAKQLIKKKVKIIGIDSNTPDNYPYEVHKLLFKHDIMIIENLTNLDKVPRKDFECIILPLKLDGADGAPCRVIARF